jgi:hypothetical protein
MTLEVFYMLDVEAQNKVVAIHILACFTFV